MGIRSSIKGAVKAGLKAAAGKVLSDGPDVSSAHRPSRAPVGQANVPAAAPEHQSSNLSPAKVRRVIQLEAVVPSVNDTDGSTELAAPESETAEVRIRARVSRDNRQCDFLVDRAVLPGLSWRFPDADSAEGSPLAEALFAHPEVAWVQVDESIIKVARRSGKEGDWRPLSGVLGQTIRDHIGSGNDAVAKRHFEGLPTPDVLRTELQTVIDTEVNPGVAAHNGHVTLEAIRGNAVHVRMGGGCQGCSAAAMTLKFGIYKAFRSAVPQLGAIYDETDHAAGQNPFYR